VTRYYLGIRVWAEQRVGTPSGWIWAQWPDGRWFLHWAEQLQETPWEAVSTRA